MVERMTKFFVSIKLFFQRHLLISLPPPNPQSSPSPTSTSDPETLVAAADQHRHQLVRAHDVDWPAKVIGFFFSWAVAIALQSPQNHERLPISFHFLSHAIVIAVTLLYLSRYMFPKFPKLAQVLEHAGVLFGVTAFFFAITTPFPLCHKLIYWTIYALSLLAIFLCNRP